MAILDLAKLEWKLSGWRPLVWELSKARGYGPYIGPIMVRNAKTPECLDLK